MSVFALTCLRIQGKGDVVRVSDRSTRVRQQVCKQTRWGRCWSCCLPSWGFAERTEYVPWRNICIPIISPETASFTDHPVFLLWCGLQIWPYLQRVVDHCPELEDLLNMRPFLSIMHAKAHSWMCEVIMTIRCISYHLYHTLWFSVLCPYFFSKL